MDVRAILLTHAGIESVAVDRAGARPAVDHVAICPAGSGHSSTSVTPGESEVGLHYRVAARDWDDLVREGHENSTIIGGT